VPVPGRHAVLENHARHPQGVEPKGDLLTLVLCGEELVSASRADDDRCSGRLVLRRQIDGDRRDVARVVFVAGVGTRRLGPERISLRFIGNADARRVARNR
jgi:hypothetical protein